MISTYVNESNVKELNRYVSSDVVKGYESKKLISISISSSSILIQFEDCSILVNDSITYEDSNTSVVCDQYAPETLSGLFLLLDKKVEKSDMDDNFEMTLSFEDRRRIKISSYKSGYESYVLSINQNEIPVL